MGKTLRRTVEKSLAALLFNAHTGGGTRIRATTDATMQLAIINCAPAVTMAIGGEREREREAVGRRIISPRKKIPRTRRAVRSLVSYRSAVCYANENGYYGIRFGGHA